ncbi:AtpZ/AtpI family protein [Oceanibaculum nanhaiense]|uniref:AtpZ/AtpI family protein n=1 Tax=Oceanibaculum nanhaiense TaxID=1909734 RepID=UPI0025A40DDF|nr:AtpZ/AtpI family protein [Oceanibaculum nanhaiense]MDM7945184.1 AtpZ/AtpI family protein [Oceanibaculum nanhaiense]
MFILTDREPEKTSLRDIAERLNKARGTQDGKMERSGGFGGLNSSLGTGLRIGVEMVSALAVGLGIGWLLDAWLDTKPWLMVVFFFLGAGAGVMNVYRAITGIGLAPGYKKPTAKARDEDGTDLDA